MKLEWMADSIGERKSWVLRDLDDGGRPRATVHVDIHRPIRYIGKHQLTIVGQGPVQWYDTAEEAMEMGTMLVGMGTAAIKSFIVATRRLT